MLSVRVCSFPLVAFFSKMAKVESQLVEYGEIEILVYANYIENS
jgi:hypothetical protein